MADKIIDKSMGNDDNSFSDMLDAYSRENKKNSFEHLLESYSPGMNEDIKVGDMVKGEIISISDDTVFVNSKTKIDGAVDKAELLDENGNFPYKIGDILELYVLSCSESEIILSQALSGIGGLNILNDAYNDNIPIEGKVSGKCKGGFHIEILQRRAFCPASQIDLKFADKNIDYVGNTYKFLVTKIDDNGRNIVLSRRELLAREQEEAGKKFLEELTVDAIIKGRVTRLMKYGAFVELFPGIEGMVHVSEVSWSRVERPEEILIVGDKVNVKVLEIEKSDNSKQHRISLSIKHVEDDPWNTINEKFHPGEKITGRVTKCTKFGAFVNIAPGIEGLVHISEMSYTKRVLKPEDVVQTGEEVPVMIKDIDTEKRRISLSIRDAEGDPWIDIREKYSVGQSLSGIIEKKEKFGYFISLEPGITGLLPKSNIIKSYDSSSIEKLKDNDSITVRIEEIKADKRRITFDVIDSTDEDNWKKYSNDTAESFGTLGEKLQQAFKVKNEKKQ